jgi:hypothetical protein
MSCSHIIQGCIYIIYHSDNLYEREAVLADVISESYCSLLRNALASFKFEN